jgi:hypothetical protein
MTMTGSFQGMDCHAEAARNDGSLFKKQIYDN